MSNDPTHLCSETVGHIVVGEWIFTIDNVLCRRTCTLRYDRHTGRDYLSNIGYKPLTLAEADTCEKMHTETHVLHQILERLERIETLLNRKQREI